MSAAFHDLPQTAFPITVELYSEITGEELFVARIDGPGALRVPPLGLGVASSVHFADGESTGAGSAGEDIPARCLVCKVPEVGDWKHDLVKHVIAGTLSTHGEAFRR